MQNILQICPQLCSLNVLANFVTEQQFLTNKVLQFLTNHHSLLIFNKAQTHKPGKVFHWYSGILGTGVWLSENLKEEREKQIQRVQSLVV